MPAMKWVSWVMLALGLVLSLLPEILRELGAVSDRSPAIGLGAVVLLGYVLVLVAGARLLSRFMNRRRNQPPPGD